MITVVLHPTDEQSRSLWRSALSLMAELEGAWTLVGGLMVQLHAFRHGVPATRLTVDIDILADSRQRPSATERIGSTLTELGFEVAEEARLRDPATAFRFERSGTVVDLLAPEKTGRRRPPKTVGNFQTIEVPGGTQALARTETVRVQLDGTESVVRTPTLLGSILLRPGLFEASSATRTVRTSCCSLRASPTRSRCARTSSGPNAAGCEPLRIRSGQTAAARQSYRTICSVAPVLLTSY